MSTSVGQQLKGLFFLFLKSISELKRILYRIAEDWNVDAPLLLTLLHIFLFCAFHEKLISLIEED